MVLPIVIDRPMECYELNEFDCHKHLSGIGQGQYWVELAEMQVVAEPVWSVYGHCSDRIGLEPV
jgi:hypothetical protein